VEIDVQGALQLMTLNVEGMYVFIAPPDAATLRKRLSGRGTETPEVLERRLQKAVDESRESHRYDHVVINDDLERALEEVRELVGLNEEPAS
jgi:guanylate kinase